MLIKFIKNRGRNNIEDIKPIPDFKGYYISNAGKVYCNLGKGNRNKDNTVDLYEIKPRLTNKGYARIYARQTSTGKRKDLENYIKTNLTFQKEYVAMLNKYISKSEDSYGNILDANDRAEIKQQEESVEMAMNKYVPVEKVGEDK